METPLRGRLRWVIGAELAVLTILPLLGSAQHYGLASDRRACAFGQAMNRGTSE
jgi:hypothetical protein